MKHFVNRKYAGPIYTHTQDGSVISGSVPDVISAVEAGADMRVVDRQSGYSVRMDNVEVSSDKTIAAGQSLWHVSMTANGPNLVSHFVPVQIKLRVKALLLYLIDFLGLFYEKLFELSYHR